MRPTLKLIRASTPVHLELPDEFAHRDFVFQRISLWETRVKWWGLGVISACFLLEFARRLAQ